MINRNKAISFICFLLIVCLLSFQTSYAEIPCAPAFVEENKRKSDPLKKVPLSGNKTFSKTKGVESYHEALVREVKFLFGREVNEEQMEAIKKANHTKGHRKAARVQEKINILKEAGFSKEEIHDLIVNAIVWVNREKFYQHKLLIKNLRKRNIKEKNLYFLHSVRYVGKPVTGNIGRINKILKKTNEAYFVDADFLGLPSISSKQANVLERGVVPLRADMLSDQQLPPSFKILFEAIQSNRKIITLKDLNLPSPTNKEAELAKQGYNPAFTKGLDHLSEWAAVRRRLEELKANPYTTHIEYFANQAINHINFIKKTLWSSLVLADKRLKELEQEVNKAIANKKVTYKWWIEFNFRLAQLVSTYKSRNTYKITERDVYEQQYLITQFPLRMAIPTINGEFLGYMTFNRAQTEGIYPLGLTIKANTIQHIYHDVNHTYRQITNIFPVGYNLFHKKLLSAIENLPHKERKKAELVYFWITHEEPERHRESLFTGIPNTQARRNIIHTISDAIDFIREKKLFSKMDVEDDYLYTYIDAFMKAYNRSLHY